MLLVRRFWTWTLGSRVRKKALSASSLIPALAAGAGLANGLPLGGVLGPLGPEATTAFVLAGMAGLFAGVVRAPLTGVMLMVEMASAYSLLLPLLVVSLLAKWTADALGDVPVYEALREM